MKAQSRLRYFLYLSILIVGCTTGKKALQKGDYDASLIKAVDRLKSSPKNTEAAKVLAAAYDMALQSHNRKIDEAKLSNDVLRWETVLYEYQRINQLSDQIYSCPTCLTIVPNPKKYVSEVADTKYKAAEVRFALGEKELAKGDRNGAKQAFSDFEKADQFYPGYKNAARKMDEAYKIALVNVVFQPAVINGNGYKLSNQYFQQQVSEYLANYRQNIFVKFYAEQEARKQNISADQLVRLDFDDFVVGQTYVKEKVEKLKRDSVVIGETRKGEKVYGTVKAIYSIFEKNISSSGLLNYAIVDLKSNKVLRNQKLTGTYVWRDSWANYQGDDRALNRTQIALTRRKEALPPPPANLFLEFTKPMYSQLVGEINNFYSMY